MGGFLARLRQLAPTAAWDQLNAGASERLERFAAVAPLYARMLEQAPHLAVWLESPATRDTPIGLHTLLEEVERARTGSQRLERLSAAFPGFLRRFRRRMSMRIAYRDVADFAPPDLIVEELTRLAEMMIRECFFIASAQATERWGEPWNESQDCPAHLSILGLGKLGGRELNFSSDVDLIYLYEGEGHTRRENRTTTTTNAEYFQKLAAEITSLLGSRDADGFLFRTDVRLRPGGAAAALASPVEAAENYYAATAQTWERLALLKARVVAGDFVGGGEFLENLHSFRYPRHAPAALLTEVAAMKRRTETEVLGPEALGRDIKSGRGGIREIEFLTQVLQLLHAARFPFLQTHSTTDALSQHARYGLLTAEEAHFLIEAYWFLRRVEHRLQMAEEQQTHELPEDPEVRATLAESLGFATLADFDAHLESIRSRVHAAYADLFASPIPVAADPADPWWPFFVTGRTGATVDARLARWFRDDSPVQAARALRLFVRGEETWPLVREQVQRFVALVPALDVVMPRLARPGETLGRISAFAERYATRNQFFAACTMNRDFLDVLALLFDRSRFIADLLTRHPEIFEEVLRPEILRKRKDQATRRRELAAHGTTTDQDYAAWLALYVRAEQVRAAIGHLLDFVPDDDIGDELTGIADATLLEQIARIPEADRLLVVALGKLGGEELSYGSDLDLVFIGRDGGPAEERAVRTLQRQLSGDSGRDPVFVLDLRLRPHSHDGPLVPTLATYRDYFARSAQIWERQVLTRARILAGPADLAAEWRAWVQETVCGRGLSAEDAGTLWRMRLRIQNERDATHPPERAFKTGSGGLVDIEFALQILQLRHGGAHESVRRPNTRAGWKSLVAAQLAPAEVVDLLLANHRHLQQLEWCLRRNRNRAVSVIPEAPEDQRILAHWLGAAGWSEYWADHRERLRQTREATIRVLTGVVPSTILETGR